MGKGTKMDLTNDSVKIAANQPESEKMFGKLARKQFEELVRTTFRRYYDDIKSELVNTDGSPEGVFISRRGEELFDVAVREVATKAGTSYAEALAQLDNYESGSWGRHLMYLANDFEVS